MNPARNVAVLLMMLVGASVVFAQARYKQTMRVTNESTANTGDDSITVNIQLAPGWNMVSNPVITANDSVPVLFPTCLGCPVWPPWPIYVDSCRLPHGRGRWLKCPAGGTVSITGIPIALDSIPVAANWNIIGSLSYPVAASTVTSIPPSIIRFPFYGFLQGSGYIRVDTLRPGSSYWVKITQQGWIVLSAGL